ncbi:helix-turn-helix domain-containing protein [Salinirubellus salinus]|uniref:Helix-turn-helix domain-containing protein n=1 Tax=Salinirubellus salinus TaxID=1364945 RepID=A0A9E7UAE2_9EURY|nr:helix-turn-helix domain-containing protein [Salinirubellus salinus]UWM53942.1 helix-turn-helix domain-containing protein [Salinirubellus salinus]
MSGRTTRLRTVVLATLCVLSLLAAPTTAVATPENPFDGDSTDGTSSEGGLGDALDGSDDTSSSDGGGAGDATSADGDDATSDTDSDDGTSSDDGADGDDDSATLPGAEDDSLLRSTLATSVNTTVGTATDTVAATTDAGDRPDWSSLDDRADGSGTDGTTATDPTGASALSDTGASPALGTDWSEVSLSESTERRTDGTQTLSGALSGAVSGATDGVVTGLTAVVDAESVAVTTTGSVPAGTDGAAPPVDVDAPSAGPAEAPAETPVRSALVPADGLVDTGAGLGAAGSGTPLPADSSPVTGFAVGLGGVAALAAVRQGLFATAGTGAVTTVSTVAASVAPALPGRSTALERLVRMLTAFRYSRYDDSDPLEHEARADVFDVVQETPGTYLSEVAERADLPLSTVRHHVRVLEREELLMGAKVRGKRRFYPAYSSDIELAAALNDDATAVVLDALSRLGGASVSELADELERHPSTVTHHLQRLEEDGLVVREREGRAVVNRLSAQTRAALDPETEATATAEASGVVASD